MRKVVWLFLLVVASSNLVSDVMAWHAGQPATFFTWSFAWLFSLRLMSDAFGGMFGFYRLPGQATQGDLPAIGDQK